MLEQPALSSRAGHAARLLEVVLAHPENAALDHIVRDATARLHADGALLSLLIDRQVVIASWGIYAPQICRATEMPFDNSVCANVLRSDEPLAIPDTTVDPRVSSAPVVRDGGLGAYLGVPVRCHGDSVGVLCVYATQARPWADEDISALVHLADDAAEKLQQADQPRADR